MGGVCTQEDGRREGGEREVEKMGEKGREGRRKEKRGAEQRRRRRRRRDILIQGRREEEVTVKRRNDGISPPLLTENTDSSGAVPTVLINVGAVKTSSTSTGSE